MEYIKLLVNEWFKEFEVLRVNEKCFKISPEIETAGTLTGFKINSPDNLKFRIKYLKSLGFKEV